MLLFWSGQVRVLIQRAVASRPGAPNLDRSTTQRSTVNLFAACGFVLDKLYQQQRQQQLLLLQIHARCCKFTGRYGKQKHNFYEYGIHKNNGFAQNVFVQAAIPAAST